MMMTLLAPQGHGVHPLQSELVLCRSMFDGLAQLRAIAALYVHSFPKRASSFFMWSAVGTNWLSLFFWRAVVENFFTRVVVVREKVEVPSTRKRQQQQVRAQPSKPRPIETGVTIIKIGNWRSRGGRVGVIKTRSAILRADA
jgi:hypothetical protein